MISDLYGAYSITGKGELFLWCGVGRKHPVGMYPPIEFRTIPSYEETRRYLEKTKWISFSLETRFSPCWTSPAAEHRFTGVNASTRREPLDDTQCLRI